MESAETLRIDLKPSLWLAGLLVEVIEERDLVLESVFKRPPVRAVRRACDGEVVAEQPGRGVNPGRGDGDPVTAGRHVAVAVEKKSAVPLGRHLDLIVGGPDGAGERPRACRRQRGSGLRAGGSEDQGQGKGQVPDRD